MRLGIFAKTFPGSEPLSVLSAVKAAGYDCVQWNWACAGLPSMPEEIPDAVLDATRHALQTTGVDIVAVSGTFNMIHPDRAVRAAGLDRLETIAQYARTIGTELITLCTGTRNPDDQWAAHPDNDSDAAWQDLMASMNEAVGIADKHGVRLGIEPELANVIDGFERAQRLVEAYPSGPLRIVMDAANLAETGDAAARQPLIEQACQTVGAHIEIAHAKDRKADGSFTTVGDGDIDFAHYFGCLAAAGFDGPVVTHGLDAADAARVASTLRSLLDDLSTT